MLHHRHLVPALIAIVAASVSGCAASEEEAADESQNDLTTPGSRWRSPVDAGEYDADDATLRVYNWADRQGVLIRSTSGTCSGSVDVTNGKARVESKDCAVDLVPSATGVRVRGTFGGKAFDASFQKRAPNAVVQSYMSVQPSVTVIEVTSSREGELAFDATLDGKALVSGATAKIKGTAVTANRFDDVYTIDKGPLDRCLLYVGRREGRYSLSMFDNEPSTCPITGVFGVQLAR